MDLSLEKKSPKTNKKATTRTRTWRILQKPKMPLFRTLLEMKKKSPHRHSVVYYRQHM